MSKSLRYRIDVEGNLKVEKLEGFGDACKQFTAAMEKDIGTPDESTRKMTDEFDKPVQNDDRQQIGL